MGPKLNTVLSLLLLAAAGCTHQPAVFEFLPAEKTGITFSNDITTTETFNALNFEYIYNGGGVAAGDVNNDGLMDLYFTGNQVSSKLFLNKGNLQFEDITLPAGVGTDRWCTGVAMADVNDDGRLDIYVSVAGYEVAEAAMENLLFINEGPGQDGVPQFREAAVAYGLNDAGYSTQAAFLDYDLDGDLDLYLLTNALEKYNRNNLEPRRTAGESNSTDRLYRNNGDGTFTNVSQEAGILIEGYGLGVNVTDLNFDGYPDIYCANDFLSNDLIWINQRDGTFSNAAGRYLKHQTHNGMGVDIADFNNDGLPDITVLDMLPEDNYRQKMMIPKVNYDKFQMKRDLGYQDQYMRNTVQLHQGFTPEGEARFSEIGNLLGMAATDWSWSVLYADFDNDGWKDAYITNGYRKDVTNLDFINYSSYNQMFGSVEAKKQKAVSDLENIAEVRVSNYLFHNRGGLAFENATADWGLERASFSNGAAYVDLDNDGDLELVTNNIDAPAFIIENRSVKAEGNHYLQIELTEDRPDLNAQNAKVLVYTGDRKQYQEYSPYRGFKSTVTNILHFGLGTNTQVDSIVVHWSNGVKNTTSNVGADQRISIAYEDAPSRPFLREQPAPSGPAFRPVTAALGIDYRHKDNFHTDLKTTRTLPHDLSKAGPALATADINGDGLEDFFVGGNRNQKGRFYLQSAAGKFIARDFPLDSMYQDVDALFLDVDRDGDQDLYVVSGGTFEVQNMAAYQDRLYLNDGMGQFQPAPDRLPEISASGSCVRASDVDGDGDLDLFVGGRIQPGRYPYASRSYLLRNESGTFRDVTPDALREPGMVTDARWTDIGGDQLEELVLVGEWMPLTVFGNDKGQLAPMALTIDQAANQTNGWWMHLNAADLDQDGDTDFLLGNIGLNSKLRASKAEPVRLYAKDFDENGAIDPLLSCYVQGREHLIHERDLLIDQIPGMKRRFPDYDKYASAGMEYTFSEEDLEGALVKTCYGFASVVLENLGNGQFVTHVLPASSQLSPVMGSALIDLDDNGTIDLLTAGNFHASETNQIGWYDASYGDLLLQRNAFQFEPVSALGASLQMDGDVRGLKSLTLANGDRLFLVSSYGSPLQAYTFGVSKTAAPQYSYNDHH
ncbi:VCBS repeat-containing protein [Flavilitoribacter nigricans]|uniref:RNA-binding protein n=1 Tax=Flavilitoribacter nigricans (strain ATCC 23147 / DSM 23189 / NBRC 102662 / NCIMB 1420 / SS-2) TaxID=1122177 RepID=A0A2D0NJF2_FLAN2|nr:VCBS repeat-containing protein [Flavilitoribacter nigricans]PHN08635.1 RNA-binding protein [Flavilitoribacter nigricans DSM 23189 = NBRC 102662]